VGFYVLAWTSRQVFDQEEVWIGDFSGHAYTRDTFAAYAGDFLAVVSGILGFLGAFASVILFIGALVWLVRASLVRIPPVPVDPYHGWDQVISRHSTQAVLDALPADVRAAFNAQAPADGSASAKAGGTRSPGQVYGYRIRSHVRHRHLTTEP
jgi:hypothetical protein